MISQFHVEAMTGGGETYGTLEEARAYAGELLGENDSLDIHITDETDKRHLTGAQREFVEDVSDPLKGEGKVIHQQGDRQRLARNRRENQNQIVKELTALVNRHDLAGVAFLVPEAGGGNRGLMIVNKHRSTTFEFLAQIIDYGQQVLTGLVNGPPRRHTDD